MVFCSVLDAKFSKRARVSTSSRSSPSYLNEVVPRARRIRHADGPTHSPTRLTHSRTHARAHAYTTQAEEIPPGIPLPVASDNSEHERSAGHVQIFQLDGRGHSAADGVFCLVDRLPQPLQRAVRVFRNLFAGLLLKHLRKLSPTVQQQCTVNGNQVCGLHRIQHGNSDSGNNEHHQQQRRPQQNRRPEKDHP